MADFIQVSLWAALSVVGLLCGILQRRGKDYFPANAFLGFAIGSQGVFYLALLSVFQGDVGGLRRWAVEARAVLWVYSIALILACWAIYLVVRTNLARPGSAMDSAGGAHPPTTGQVDEWLAGLERADRHDVLNAMQRRRARDWLTRREARRTGGRRDAAKDDGR